MKKLTDYLTPTLATVALVFSVAAFNKTCAAPTTPNTPSDPAAPVMASAPAGQPVDLTYAAEKALPSVVHIKYVQNSYETVLFHTEELSCTDNYQILE